MEEFIPKDSDKLKVIAGVDQPLRINPSAIKKLGKKPFSGSTVENYLERIQKGDITYLSRAITLVESINQKDQQLAGEIVEKCLPLSGKSLRIGITGIPGVGKSTFIEYFGSWLIQKQGSKVAVLAVDPSSAISKGSILGDKTRMSRLSSEKNAYIRPSPSAGSLGGVARKTREIIIICEAAGFDTIIIETVGVGQSETVVHSMVDFFLLLLLAGAGDELQGMKRGIMELADLLVINKSDDFPREKVMMAKRTYENAIHLYPPAESGWVPPVLSCSALTGQGIDDVWDHIRAYTNSTKLNGYFHHNRELQARKWFYETINNSLSESFFRNKTINQKLKFLEKEVVSNRVNPYKAAMELLSMMHQG